LDEPKKQNRQQRRTAKARGEERQITDARFLKLADKFIDVANRENENINATDLHMVFLYAAAAALKEIFWRMHR